MPDHALVPSCGASCSHTVWLAHAPACLTLGLVPAPFAVTSLASQMAWPPSSLQVFVLIVYFMGGLKYSAGAFFSNWASVLLAVLTAQSIGLLIGSVVTVSLAASQHSLPSYLRVSLTSPQHCVAHKGHSHLHVAWASAPQCCAGPWEHISVRQHEPALYLKVSGALQHPKTGQTIATIVALTCVLVAGFFVLDTPVWIDW